jgi:putative peptide zinc metalloprotease protein
MDALHSQHWYRVAALRPQLGAHVRVARHVYRGERWYVLQDQVSGRHHRLNTLAYAFVARMDGQYTVDTLWQRLFDAHGDDTPGQDELIQILSQLIDAGLVQCDIPAESAAILRRRDAAKKQARSAMLNPFSFRVPLWDPDAFLIRTLPAVRGLFRPATALLWGALVLWAMLVAWAHSAELVRHAASYTLTPRYLLLLWLCYPVIKALHELAHAFTVRAGGGEVHELGVSFMLLVPVPYVDASAASAFPERRSRMLVDSVGIAVELLIAAAGLALWLNTQPGWLNDVGFVALLIGGVSTVLFNGNPLFKYDGYYLLADAIDMPNLAQRSNRYVLWLVQRYVLRIVSLPALEETAYERRWLLGYACAAFAYRLLVFAWMLVWAANYSVWLGGLLAAMLAYTMLVKPACSALDFLLHHPALDGKRQRSLVVSSLLVLLPLGFMTLVPLPYSARAEGVVWLPEHARVRAGGDGFIERIYVADGQPVQVGQPLLVIVDPVSVAETRRLTARVAELEAEQQQAYSVNPTRAQILGDALAQARAERAMAAHEVSARVLLSQSAGRFAMPRADDMPGRFVHKGEVLAHVLSPSQTIVRVAVSAADVAPVRSATAAIRVRLADDPAHAWHARLLREVPAGGTHLPSAALGDRGGGERVTDPADADGLTTLEPFFLFDLSLTDAKPERIGARARVHFEFGSAPLLMQWTRRLRQVFLAPLNH